MCDIFETRNLDYNLSSRYYGIKWVGNLNLFKKKKGIGNPKDVITSYANNIFTV